MLMLLAATAAATARTKARTQKTRDRSGACLTAPRGSSSRGLTMSSVLRSLRGWSIDWQTLEANMSKKTCQKKHFSFSLGVGIFFVFICLQSSTASFSIRSPMQEWGREEGGGEGKRGGPRALKVEERRRRALDSLSLSFFVYFSVNYLSLACSSSLSLTLSVFFCFFYKNPASASDVDVSPKVLLTSINDGKKKG